MKISGLCGRLKCCLNFELDTYLDALDGFPEVKNIQTKKGRAWVQKTDIFKETIWFAFESESTWYPLHISAVKEIMKLNANGEKPDVFTDGAKPAFSGVEKPDPATSMDFVDGVGTTVLKEESRRGNRKGRSKRKPNPNPQNRRKSEKPGQEQGNKKTGQSASPSRNKRKPSARKPGGSQKQEGTKSENKTEGGRQKPASRNAKGPANSGSRNRKNRPNSSGNNKPKNNPGKS